MTKPKSKPITATSFVPLYDSFGNRRFETKVFQLQQVDLIFMDVRGEMSCDPFQDQLRCNVHVCAPGINPLAVKSAVISPVDMTSRELMTITVEYWLFEGREELDTDCLENPNGTVLPVAPPIQTGSKAEASRKKRLQRNLLEFNDE